MATPFDGKAKGTLKAKPFYAKGPSMANALRRQWPFDGNGPSTAMAMALR
jgi:hypothetical protein